MSFSLARGSRSLRLLALTLLVFTAHAAEPARLEVMVRDGQTGQPTPCTVTLTDAAGKVVHTEQGWFWARQGEQRVCVGCHAGPERAPDNAVPEALLTHSEPVSLISGGK